MPIKSEQQRNELHKTIWSIADDLRGSVDGLGQSVVMVTHEPEAAAWADTVIFLRDGHVVAELADPNRDRVLDALRELSEADSAPAIKGA